MRIKKNGKVIKLTESDLQRIVKRVLNEQEAGDDIKKRKLPKEILNFIKKYKIKAEYNLTSVNGELGIRFGVNQGKNHSDIGAEDINTYEKNKNNLSKCKERAKFKNELVNKDVKTGEGSHKARRWEIENEIENEIAHKYPNMQYCGVIQKVQNIINRR